MKHSKHMKIKESSKVDIRKHRFVPNMSTSSKMMKSQKDKERDRERRDWKQKLRNGDYDEYDESGSTEQCPCCGEFINVADNETEIECPYCGEMIEMYSDDVDLVSDDTYKFTVTDIEWDTDGEDATKLHLPETLVVDVPMEYLDNGSDAVEDYISDFLSDTYGYCHKGFSVEGLDDEDEFNESIKDFDESDQENWLGIDGATYIDDDDDEYIRYNNVVVPYDVFVDQLQDVYLKEVNPEDINYDEFDDWMSSKTSSDRIRKELDIISKEMMNETHNNDWFGIKSAKFIYHGDWSDPEVQYDGVSLNYYDVEAILLDEYREKHPEDKNDKGFDDWMRMPEQKSSIQSALDILVQGGCGEPIDDESEKVDELE